MHQNMTNYRLLFNPAGDELHSEMIDSQAPTPEAMERRAEALLSMLDARYKSCTIFAQDGQKWRAIAIKSRFL